MNSRIDFASSPNAIGAFVLIYNLQIGKFIGDQIPGIGYTVFKVRLKNSDIQKGKSSGYRVIYQLKDNSCVLMLLIYAKSDQTDIPAQQIQDIINKFDNS
jgi:mRNA-degrading endonuclease RelE of RelBE toxin-antitoxin system